MAEKRREVKGKGEKERYTHLNAEFQRIVRKGKKASSVNKECVSSGYEYSYAPAKIVPSDVLCGAN